VLTRLVLILALLFQPLAGAAAMPCAALATTTPECGCCVLGGQCGPEMICDCSPSPEQQPQTPPQFRTDQTSTPALLPSGLIAILPPAPQVRTPAPRTTAHTHAGPSVQALLCTWRT
jgi:hypothetical protein